MPRLLLLALTLCFAFTARAAPSEPFELRDGDTVAILGDAFAEREQTWSYLETLLATRWPDRNIRFRNLGWSGDTVYALSRAMFDKAPQGMERMLQAIDEVKPTVYFLCYGMAESFDGEAGLPAFREGYGQLLDKLQKPGVRFVLVSPIKHEKLPPPLPDPTAHNAQLKLYVDAIKAIAEQRGHRFVDLFDTVIDDSPTRSGGPLTENGIHLNACGYWLAAGAIERGLGLPPRGWSIRIDASQGGQEVAGVTVADVKTQGGVRFRTVDEKLPPCRPEGEAVPVALPGAERVLRVTGLQPGRYTLNVDGKKLLDVTAEAAAAGIRLPSDDRTHRADQTAAAAVEKNIQYFNQFRPANYTYIFGFRKHEQGQNAKEMPQFDEPIAAKEKRIAELRQGGGRTYELVPAEPRNN